MVVGLHILRMQTAEGSPFCVNGQGWMNKLVMMIIAIIIIAAKITMARFIVPEFTTHVQYMVDTRLCVQCFISTL